VEILSGLAQGEVVVSEGSDRLADGMPVEAVASGPGEESAARPSDAPAQGAGAAAAPR
jgi:multidrug efflux system membrane fusion protein